MYRPQMNEFLKAKVGIDKDDDLIFASINEVASIKQAPNKAKDEIAIVYAEGGIDMGETNGVNTAKLVEDLTKIQNDKNVKAVDFLITNGANVNEGGKGDKPPLWCAFPDKYKELDDSLACINLLLKAGADKNNPVVLQEARKSSFSKIRELFIDDKENDEDKNASSVSKPQKIQKPSVLHDISSGNMDAGKLSLIHI